LFRHWVIGSLIRHSSFGFSHSLVCATQAHGPDARPILEVDASQNHFAEGKRECYTFFQSARPVRK
jgi:hypothetical protein